MEYPSQLQDKVDYYNSLKKVIKPLRKQILKEKIMFIIKHNKHYLTRRFLVLSSLIIAIIFAGLYYLRPIIIHTRYQSVPGEVIYVPDSTKTMDKFLYELGRLESNNNYKIVNQFGYMGRYQIGRQALKQIGLGEVSNEQFLNNAELQEVAMKLLLKENKRILASHIGKYQSRVINGIYITESSILAASHMAPQGVIDFLTSGGEKVFKDGNGTPITKYLKQFSGYKIKLN